MFGKVDTLETYQPPNTFLDVLHNPCVKLPREEDLAVPDVVKGSVEDLLDKFLIVVPVAGAEGKGDIVDGGTPQAGDDGSHG